MCVIYIKLNSSVYTCNHLFDLCIPFHLLPTMNRIQRMWCILSGQGIIAGRMLLLLQYTRVDKIPTKLTQIFKKSFKSTTMWVHNRELKQHITSLTITSPSLHHHFLCLFIYLRFLAGLVQLSTELTQPTLNYCCCVVLTL